MTVAGGAPVTRLRDYCRWPWSLDMAWLALPLFVLTVRLLLQPITPEDYWWSLAMGTMIDAGRWPDANLFLYTLPPEQPFFNQPWLAQWIMARISALGHTANLVLHVVLALIAWLLAIRATVRRGAKPPVVGVMAVIGYSMGAGSFTVRTQMFAYLPFVCCLLLVQELTRGESTRWRSWAALLALTALWANLHGTFVFAPLLLLGAGIGALIDAAPERRSRMALTFGAGMLAVLGACMVHPGGVENLLYPLRLWLATNGAVVVQEWKPPSLSTPQGALFAATLLGTGIYLAWQRPRPGLASLGLLALTAALAATSWRAVPWWAFVWIVLVAPSVSRHLRPRAARPSLKSSALVATLVACFLVSAGLCLPNGPAFTVVDTARLYGERRYESALPDLRVFSSGNPVTLVESLLAHGNAGRIFNYQNIGGLLEWVVLRQRHGAPGPSAPFLFVDQRVELLDAAIWQRYFRIAAAADGWESLLEEYDVQTLVLHAVRQAALVAAAAASPHWVLLTGAGDFVVFERRRAPALLAEPAVP